MKKFICILAFALLSATIFSNGAFAARQTETTLRGTIIDATGAPVGFATAYLSKEDGSVVTGVTAGEDGQFELKAYEGSYTLTVSLVGYRDASQPIKLSGTLMELPPIRLEEDAQLLEGAAVQAIMPKTRLTGEGIATSVRGSVLENAGTANDVLKKVPGLIKGQNGLEVIGKGAPVVYINGRRLTDASELDRLLSHEIQSVEVINNPGAQYDATVKAVVRIKTIRRQGEGFGFNVNLADEQSLQKKENNDPNGAVNVNYRTGGVDIFAGVNASKSSQFQISDLVQNTTGPKSFHQEEDLTADFVAKNLATNAGVNWQISDNHFTGFKVDWSRRLNYDEHEWMEGDIFLNGKLLDHLVTNSTASNGAKAPTTLGVNAYYNGTVGKLNIDLNLDYFNTSESNLSHTVEDSDIENATITTESASDNKLYAAKLVLSYPVWKGMLQLGTEETFSRRSDRYTVQGWGIPAASSRVQEDNIAAFFNYGFMVGQIGQLSAGLRYEHVNYAYDDLLGNGSFSRKYDNFFPSISFGGVFGPVQGSVSYSIRTTRPSFSMLSSAIRYNNRYTLQSGNPALQPMTVQSFNLAAVWKFLTLSANYSRSDNPTITWSELYNDEGVIMLQPRNLDEPVRALSVYLVATPTIGPWTMMYTVGMQQTWLTIDAQDPSQPSGIRTLSYTGRPLWIAQLNNIFNFNHGWQVELGGEYHSPGYVTNALLSTHYFDLTAAIQKTLLKDGSLVLRLEGSDLAGLGHYNIWSDLGGYNLNQSNLMDSQRIKFSIRYRFNAAQSKYKGTGAGNDTRSRMK